MELVAEPIMTMSDSELLQRHANGQDRSARADGSSGVPANFGDH